MNEAESQWKVKEAAKFLSCSTSWIYKAAAKGLIPCIRIGAMLRFDPEQLRAFARAHALAVAQPASGPTAARDSVTDFVINSARQASR
jgi:excisionase family DNA binding protein